MTWLDPALRFGVNDCSSGGTELLVLDVNRDSIAERGRLPMSDYQVRSVVVGDRLVAITSFQVIIYDFVTLQELDTVPF